MLYYHVMKRNNKSLRFFIKTVITLLVVAAIAIGAWKARHMFTFDRADFGGLFEKEQPEEKNIYNIYTTKIHRAAKGIYYVKFQDVVCDGASDYDGTPHYFRINITFETNSEEAATALLSANKEITANLRNVMKDLKVKDRNMLRVMNYTKDHAKRQAEKLIGKEALKGVYFESFLTQ